MTLSFNEHKAFNPGTEAASTSSESFMFSTTHNPLHKFQILEEN